jgi:hypothetical protein
MKILKIPAEYPHHINGTMQRRGPTPTLAKSSATETEVPSLDPGTV